jgi:hypothetical protein
MMEKTKRKSKPNRRKWIIAILLVLFGGCAFISFKIHYNINNPRHEAPIFAGIDDAFSTELVENRLLEYVTIGESTCEEVKAFGDEQLAFEHYSSSCDFQETSNQIFYWVNRTVFLCYDYYLEIIFIFENGVLSDIEYDTHYMCL